MTIPVHDPKHPHHAVWREYTQSLLDGRPKVVEWRPEVNKPWETVRNPLFGEHNYYRIARPMLTLTYSVPMPVTEPLKKEQSYWVASNEYTRPRGARWNSDSYDNCWLRAGLIYLTEADAQAAIDARNAAMTAALEAAK